MCVRVHIWRQVERAFELSPFTGKWEYRPDQSDPQSYQIPNPSRSSKNGSHLHCSQEHRWPHRETPPHWSRSTETADLRSTCFLTMDIGGKGLWETEKAVQIHGEDVVIRSEWETYPHSEHSLHVFIQSMCQALR